MILPPLVFPALANEERSQITAVKSFIIFSPVGSFSAIQSSDPDPRAGPQLKP